MNVKEKGKINKSFFSDTSLVEWQRRKESKESETHSLVYRVSGCVIQEQLSIVLVSGRSRRYVCTGNGDIFVGGRKLSLELLEEEIQRKRRNLVLRKIGN